LSTTQKMDLRITGGKWKGRNVVPVPDPRTRFTPQKVRNALFSSLQSTVCFGSSSFLDLCAGSGIVGFEAMSRGFSKVTFVDVSQVAISALYKTMQSLSAGGEMEVRKQNAISFVQKSRESFSVVFVDPPFNDTISRKVFLALQQNETILEKTGILVVEHPAQWDKDTLFPRFRQKHHARYGSVCITMFGREEEGSDEGNRH